MIKLACTHCRHHFELESIAGAVCPSCGWSSSVIPAAEFNTKNIKSSDKPSSAAPMAWLPDFLIFCAKVCGVGLVIILVIILLFRLGGRLVHSKDNSGQVKPSFFAGLFQGAKKENPSVKVNITQAADSAKRSVLSDSENDQLHSVLTVPEQYELTDGERKMLELAQNLLAGDMEKLPSGPWSIDQYKEFIKSQEQMFHMPLPRSYKKSLEELFLKTYATAYDHFLAGRMLAARDAYVAALGFPVYANDVRKHRAVILTMLRGFINDVLAKIGAMNFTLARQGTAGLTQQVSTVYADLQKQIRTAAYTEALDSIEKLNALLTQSSAGASVLSAPAYNAAFGSVDADIQATLKRILQVPAFGFDATALLSDLTAKKALILKLTDINRKNSVENYAQAVENIKTSSWGEAEKHLREVTTPENLKQDAEQKIVLIEKMTAGSQG